MPGQSLDDSLTHRGKIAGKQRMVIRKTTASRHRCHEDARVMAFGQLHRLIPGTVAVNRGTYQKSRTGTGIQRRSNVIDQCRFGTQRRAYSARQHRLRGQCPVVGRNRYQYRTTRRHHRQVVGAGDCLRNVLATSRLDRPLDIGPWQFGRSRRRQEGIKGQYRTRLLPGTDDQWCAVFICRKYGAHRVAHADGRVQIDKGRVARRLRVTVGHADHDRFLQTQHVAKVGRKIKE